MSEHTDESTVTPEHTDESGVKQKLSPTDIIAIVTAAVSVISQLTPFIQQLIATGQQSGALTPDQLTALQSQLNTLFASPAWQPDKLKALPAVSTTTDVLSEFEQLLTSAGVTWEDLLAFTKAFTALIKTKSPAPAAV